MNSPKMEAAIAAAYQRLMKMPRWKIKLKLFLIKKGWFGHGFWYRSLRHANLGTKFSKGAIGAVGSTKFSVGVLKWFMRISKF